LALRLVQLFLVVAVYFLLSALWVAWFFLALGMTMLSLALDVVFRNTAKALCPRKCAPNAQHYQRR
jgi:hypothetical protein